MIKLRYKLGLFNVLSKFLFGAVFVLLMPAILERINTLQTDNELINKRERVIDLIERWGVEFFLEDVENDTYGSYNILREEYISLERVELEEHWNFIEVTRRNIEDEIIDYRVLNYTFLIDGEMYLLEIGKSLSSIHKTEKNITKLMWLFLLVFVLISSITDISFATFIIRPLERINQKLKKTSTPAQFDTTLVRTSTTEFIQLDQTLNELMQKINELFRKEKETTSNISHELLTPISVLRGKLENLMLQKDLSNESLQKTEEALKTLHRLKTMVNSLLMIARVESHQYLKEDTFFAEELMEEVLEELSPMAEDKNITFHSHFDLKIKFEHANRALLFNMFYNIVNNAIKYTQSNGVISLATFRQNNYSVLKISDNGPGMNEIQLQNLFTRFKNTAKHKNSGTGIGLAISKTIADFHGIQIQVKSTETKGTEFFFYIPA